MIPHYGMVVDLAIKNHPGLINKLNPQGRLDQRLALVSVKSKMTDTFWVEESVAKKEAARAATLAGLAGEPDAEVSRSPGLVVVVAMLLSVAEPETSGLPQATATEPQH